MGWWLGLLLVISVAGCTHTGAAQEPADPAAGRPAAPVTMTNVDPSDPAAWAEAEHIAARQHAGLVHKHSDTLPFLFAAERARSVLIHQGAVVTRRGPGVAGAYLRDLGILRGNGPPLDDVLWALWALDALPKVEPIGTEGYVNVPSSRRLADVTARIEYDGPIARVVLHYFKPEGPLAKDAHPASSAPPGGRVGSAVRGLVRMTLDIPETGDAAWRREDIIRADPG